MNPFPTVDLSRADAKLVDTVCHDTGFLAIVGHGFPEDALESTWRAARAFFELPRAAKMDVAMPYAGYPYGYAPLPGQLRAGAHSDYGSLTILFAEPGSRGLQTRSLDGVWREVPIEKGAFIVNVGDLLARWSNDRWVSTVHRVVCEPEPRQSMAFFHLPNWDAEIACIPGEPPRYEPVTAGEHLMSKFERAVKI